MVFAAFVISTLVIIFFMGALVAGQGRKRELDRKKLEDMLSGFCDEVACKDPEHAQVRTGDIDVSVECGHTCLDFEAKLPQAILGYDEIFERWSGTDPTLVHDMDSLGIALGAKDTVTGRFVMEPGKPESIAALRVRLDVVKRIRDLRRNVPAELLSRLPGMRSSSEIDALLDGLSEHYPEAPETPEAFRAACQRDPGPKLLERARRWLDEAELASLAPHH